MNAQLKYVARALVRPTYRRWDLVRLNDRDAWSRENRKLLMGWYSDIAPFADGVPTLFSEFTKSQFDIERSHYEQLKADSVGEDEYVEREAE